MNLKEKNDKKEIILSQEQAVHNIQKENLNAESGVINNPTTFQNSEKQTAKIQNLQEQLKAKEQLLNNHINAINTSNASIEFDLEGNILSANKNFLEIMGYNEIDLLGKHHSIFVNPSYSKSNAYQLFWSSLKKGIYQKDEFIRVAKNGKSIWLLGSYNPIFDTNGKPYKILKIATDITLAKTQFLQLAVQAQEKEKRASELIIANKELAFQNKEKEKRAAELVVANKELKFQNEQKEKRASELIIANKELAFQNKEKEKRAAELVIANKELKFQNEQKEKRASELIIANKELAFQNKEKEKRAAELVIANKELKFQNEQKEKRASELIIANKELAFQNKEKEKRAAELVIANKELKFQNEQKEKRASELIIANKELAFQNKEKEKRAAELVIANKELKFQNEQKEKRASELIIANKELAFQNKEKEKRAAELVIANKELKFQNEQKEKRASELIIANKELAFQSNEKEKRAAELIIANKKLAAENILKQKRKVEKEKRAAELIVTNRELAYQEKRTQELTLANNELKKAQEELESFSYSVSHDLRAPIRAINGYTQILIEDHIDAIDDDGKNVLQAIIKNSNKMGVLIDDLLAFSKLGRKQVASVNINMATLLSTVISDMIVEKDENTPIFEIDDLAPAYGDPSLIKQVWINLISNAIKYSKYKSETRIKITSASKNDKIIYSIKDWGAGFDMEYYDKLFGVFQRLHSQEEFSGTGIGLAIVQKIINRHYGTVWAESKLDAGAVFYFSLPDTKH
ncbi:PAS domain-containing sensor histidine kinase [Flavobacterium sp. Root420]|uniref:PAS domain-containing sensor histidine kinase n=1 Tax=Flavobacterium sp. Root420 TaxID=1736533 RepID=UPI0009E76236|nr:PAS domain-containing sensor histidine kinase [Flavobacterium sp. Root420]